MLYHYFPGGKDDLVAAVLDFLERWLEQHLRQALRREGDALTRLREMCDQVSELYEGGQQPCLFAILLMGSARDIFHAKLQKRLRAWINAIAAVLMELGMDEILARQRGEDAAIAIQGALILAHGLKDLAPFRRVVEQLGQTFNVFGCFCGAGGPTKTTKCVSPMCESLPVELRERRIN